MAPDLADALRRVSVEKDPLAAADPADLCDGLDRADLIVGVHDADMMGRGQVPQDRGQVISHDRSGCYDPTPQGTLLGVLT